MKKRFLGKSGIKVGEIGYGAMPLSHAYGEPLQGEREQEGVDLIHRAVDLGVTLIDTAEIYGPFTNETLVGKGLKGIRDRVVLATKVGIVPREPGVVSGRDGRPETIKRSIEGSLQRLGTDFVDLYQLHRVDPNVPIEDSVGAMADLVRQGKVRSIGLSEVDVPELERAISVHPIASLQSELSLWTRDPLPEILPWCVKHDVAFLAFSPLGRGFLTGKMSQSDLSATDFRSTLPRFQGENFESNRRLVDQLEIVAKRLGATNAQVAIAWTLAKSPNVIPIPGTKRIHYLEENVRSADLVLSPQDLADLDAISEPVGGRYA